jgi:uncharacterized membrane protein YcaP (DUF421 family)
MNTFIQVFGTGELLNSGQMAARAFVIFVITLTLIRLSGRRSFGLRTPLDNIIVILLGALLSRAITGASPFFPVIAASTVIALLHRILGWLTTKNRYVKMIVDGDEILLYENGRFLEDNMSRAMLCKEDIIQGIRKSTLTDDLSKIERIYIDRTGEISILKKKS